MAKQTEEKLILTVEVDSKDSFEDLEKLKALIILNKKEQQDLAKAYKQGTITLEEFTKEQVRLEATLKLNQNQYNQTQKSVTGVKTQFDKLIDANKELVKTNQSISDSLKEASNELNIAGVNVGGLTEKLSAGINPLAAAAAGVSALAGLYLSSAAGARDLQSAQSQLSTSFKVISNDLAELVGADGKGGGLLSQLAFRLNEAVFGLSAAVTGQVASQAELAIQELEVAELTAQQFAKNQLSLSEQQRRIRDDESRSLQERLAGAQSVEQFINAREAELVRIQEQKLQQLRILLSLDKNNLELQKQVKQVEFEISDIREDSEGKRTEALNGVIAIQKLIRQQAIDDNAAITNSTAEVTTKQAEIKDEAFLKDLERINARRKAEEDAANFVVDVTNLEIDETEAAKDAAAQRDAERVANQTKIEQDAVEQRLGLAAQLFGGLNTVLSAFGKKSKAVNSGLALANTFLGVTEILKAPTAPFVEPFASAVRAIQIGTTLATGLAAVARINSVSGFASGGLTGTRITAGMGANIRRSNGDDMLATVKTGEVILNQSQQARLGGAATFRAIGVPGFATGGVTGVTETRNAFSSVQADRAQADLRSSLSNLQPVLVLQDFELTQNTRNRIQTTAQVI